MLRGMSQVVAHVCEARTLRYLDMFEHAITGSRSFAYHLVQETQALL
jgi:hypothetical protein